MSCQKDQLESSDQVRLYDRGLVPAQDKLLATARSLKATNAFPSSFPFAPASGTIYIWDTSNWIG